MTHSLAPLFQPPLHPAVKQLASMGTSDHGARSSRRSAAKSLGATPRRAKSNSERGKEFRAKRKKYEGELEAAVYRLRAQVTELDLSRGLWEKQLLETRQTQQGSLVRLLHEYFSMFRFGLKDPSMPMGTGKRAILPSSPAVDDAREKIRRQEAFLEHIMDPDVIVGGYSGPRASIMQWRRYTLTHDSLRHEIESVCTMGSEEMPIIEVHSVISGRINRETFKFMFPTALHNEPLVQKFVQRPVTYKATFCFQFTDEGRIALEAADIGIVEGLQNAGFAIADIAELMQMAVLESGCLIPAPEAPPGQQGSTRTPPRNEKLSVDFLLGESGDSCQEENEVRQDERVVEILWSEPTIA